MMISDGENIDHSQTEEIIDRIRLQREDEKMTEKILVLQVLIIVTLLKSNNGHSNYVNTGMFNMIYVSFSQHSV